MINETFYTCPKCGIPSHFMIPNGDVYEPTLEERNEKPYLVFIGNEVLECPCGRKNTWFDMVEKQKVNGELPSMN